MFKSTVRSELRPVIREIVGQYPGLPAYVGGSGNLTVERVLADAGVREIRGCDVALYPCVIGHLAAGDPVSVDVADPGYDWLKPYLDTPTRAAATLLLASEFLPHAESSELYGQRMLAEYRCDWDRLHAGTVARVTRALDGVRLTSFYEMDPVDFLRDAPEESIVLSFPPTYAGGYEKLFDAMHRVFGWVPPDYVRFDERRFNELLEIMQSKRAWVLMVDKPLEGMEPGAVTYPGPIGRSRPVYLYSSANVSRLMLVRQRTELVPAERVSDELVGPLGLVPITGAQLNLLRSEYLGKNIVTVSGTWSFALLDGKGRLIGAMSFTHTPTKNLSMTEVYMLSDFAIRPTAYPRLSKLVVAASLSREVQELLKSRMVRRVDSITTTAFTGKAESMKYRGLYRKTGGGEDYVNYAAQAGRWTLEEALRWWTDQHDKSK